jgi:hypothetical protein
MSFSGFIIAGIINYCHREVFENSFVFEIERDVAVETEKKNKRWNFDPALVLNRI